MYKNNATDVHKKIKYPDWDFHYFPQSLNNNSGIALQNRFINRGFSCTEPPNFVKIICQIYPTNVVVKWLTLLFPIWEVPGSNLSLETSYPD
jgi:hypothetical protein